MSRDPTPQVNNEHNLFFFPRPSGARHLEPGLGGVTDPRTDMFQMKGNAGRGNREEEDNSNVQEPRRHNF